VTSKEAVKRTTGYETMEWGEEKAVASRATSWPFHVPKQRSEIVSVRYCLGALCPTRVSC